MTARLFFVRSPRPGRVKTRLAAGVGDAAACELYRAFGLDMLDALREDAAQRTAPAPSGPAPFGPDHAGPAPFGPSSSGHLLHVFFHPPGDEALVRQWLGPETRYVPQAGDGLGPRMASAFASVFGLDGAGDAGRGAAAGERRAVLCRAGGKREGREADANALTDADNLANNLANNLAYASAKDAGRDTGPSSLRRFSVDPSCPPEAAILVGSDIPALRPHHVARAEALLRSHDAVLGPAEDGGYYLVGFRRAAFCPEALCGVAFEGAEVLEQTLAILHRAGRSVALAESLPDVDTLDDLREQLRRGMLDGTRTGQLATALFSARDGE